MDKPDEKRHFAWQPLTPRGVAAFVRASLGRLLLVQFIFAMAACAVIVDFLDRAWFPVISEGIKQLPPQGEIRSGQLVWPGDSPQRLAEGKFLALAVDLSHEGEARSPAHLQMELGRSDFKIFSLLGFVQESYPRAWRIAFNRTELEPWWGAWAPAILAIAGGGVVAGLLCCWAIMATVYCWAVWLVGFFANRTLSLAASWRLAGAALMPGALFLTGALYLYGSGGLDLVRLAAAVAVHLVVGWIYLVIVPLRLPRKARISSDQNPFAAPVQPEEKTDRSRPPDFPNASDKIE
jgi:hypothetical protein